MKLKTTLIAFAAACTGIPATLVAQPPDLRGIWVLEISVPGMSQPVSAVSVCHKDRRFDEFDYVRVPSFFGGVKNQIYHGIGLWAPEANGRFGINYKIELPNGGSQQVQGEAILSGDQLTGGAEVKFLNQAGKAVYNTRATVVGHRAPRSGLTAKR
jgi:hypothetical protein